MVERKGSSGNLIDGDGGENRVLRLLVESLKLQPCNAGLLDGRDALLAADQSLYGGEHACEIWTAFARRGMGVSAAQGSADSLADNTAAFDVPTSCVDVLFADGFDASPEIAWRRSCPVMGPSALPGSCRRGTG